MSANLSMRARNIAASSGLFLWSAAASAGWFDTLNMPVGITEISEEVYDLHMLILWICVVIGIVVFGAMFYSIYHHRKSKGAVAAQFHESMKLEILWTVVPVIILVVMAIPATGTLIRMEDTSRAELTVTATGYQWRWKYDYLFADGSSFSFFSALATPREQIDGVEEKSANYLLEVDKHVVLPVDTKIRILTTAADVIHAWWVPALGWKRDAIPGFINENWATIKADAIGTHRGQCAELCGKDHGYMPIVVDAVSKEDFQAWVVKMKEEQGGQTASAEIQPQPVVLTDKLGDEQLIATLNNKNQVDLTDR